ncbi:MAG: aldehyde reductase [Solirubrobacteraceae bacterium]|nr:aldehyde reductase [Solirubrobacteraceae bacterium]
MSRPPADPSQTVLVTGGSGYLAGWVIAEALNAGYSVRTTLRTPSREAEVLESVGRISHHTDRLSFAAADLTKDDGWAEAVDGCRYVLHVASPFPPEQPKNPDDLIVPAREGTLRVLKAALDAGAERIVVTSSVAAIDRPAGEAPGRVLTEADWADGANEKNSPYGRSKTIAEQAAWALVEERGQKGRLATVNPGAIIGPLISDDRSFSLQLIERMLKGEPAVPKLGFSMVDVRDIARLELAAMTTPEAGGSRFIGVARFAWMSEVAKTLRDQLGSEARKVPKRTAPNFLIRAMALFDGSVKSIVPNLGVKTEYSHDHATAVLGWQPRPLPESVVDCARSILAHDAQHR